MAARDGIEYQKCVKSFKTVNRQHLACEGLFCLLLFSSNINLHSNSVFSIWSVLILVIRLSVKFADKILLCKLCVS